MKSKFNYYEIVNVKEIAFTINNGLNGLKGVVLGMAEDEKGNWGYAIHIYSMEEVWDLPEEYLESSGQFTSREEFYDGSNIEMKVDGKTGEGKIVD